MSSSEAEDLAEQTRRIYNNFPCDGVRCLSCNSLQVDSVYRRRKHPSNVLTAMAMTVPSVRISSTHIRHARNNGYVPTASAHIHTYSAPLKKRQNEDKKAAREAQFNSERPAWLQRKSKEPAEKPTSA